MPENEFYIVPKASLDATADAIREKTGSQASIEYTQDGFADAIEDIPTGGTTISTAGEYTVFSGDTVTMGTGITGLLNAQAQRVLTHSWNFTTGLTDSVAGLSVTLGGNATQNSSGITIASASDYVSIPQPFTANKIYEMDITSISKTISSGHGRLLMWTDSEGFILQSGSNWNVYYGQWGTQNNGNSVGAFDNKTLRVITKPTNYYYKGASHNYALTEFYVDGSLWFSPVVGEAVRSNNIQIGSANGQSMATVVVTGFRIYDGIVV